MVDKNQEVEKCYTVEFNDNDMVTSILVEEVECFGRWLYKRNPQGMELPLTDAIFEETIFAFLHNGIWNACNIYARIRTHDEYYANLMKKVYKKYLQEYVLTSYLHQDAFWGD